MKRQKIFSHRQLSFVPMFILLVSGFWGFFFISSPMLLFFFSFVIFSVLFHKCWNKSKTLLWAIWKSKQFYGWNLNFWSIFVDPTWMVIFAKNNLFQNVNVLGFLQFLFLKFKGFLESLCLQATSAIGQLIEAKIENKV